MPQKLPSSEPEDALFKSKVSALHLKPVITVQSDIPCKTAIDIMRDKGFDQLPVLAPNGRKLVGLVSLGTLLSRMTHGRATGDSPVSDAMFDFSKISEVVTDPRDIGLAPSKPHGTERDDGATKPQQKARRFVEITMDTSLSALNRFFEWNSAAIVTEKDTQGALKPLAVATKVDLLTWLLHGKRP